MDAEGMYAKVNEIRQILSDCQGGKSDPESIRKFREILRSLGCMAGFPHDAQVVIGEIEDNSKILYSPRKHHNHGGAQKVRSFIYQDCSRLEMIIDRYKKALDQ